MLAQLTSQKNVLRLFIAAAVIIIVEYIAVLFAPTESSAGIYVLSVMGKLIGIYVICVALLVICVMVSAIRKGRAARVLMMVASLVVLLLPLIKVISVPQLLREHVTTLQTQNHVYQLANDMLPVCPDTFDSKTYTCYSRVFLYQCDRLGLMCQIETRDVLIKHDHPLRLKAVGTTIQIIGDQNTVDYEMPV